MAKLRLFECAYKTRRVLLSRGRHGFLGWVPRSDGKKIGTSVSFVLPQCPFLYPNVRSLRPRRRPHARLAAAREPAATHRAHDRRLPRGRPGVRRAGRHDLRGDARGRARAPAPRRSRRARAGRRRGAHQARGRGGRGRGGRGRRGLPAVVTVFQRLSPALKVYFSFDSFLLDSGLKN